MYANVYEFKAKHATENSSQQEKCMLEQQFPRIVGELIVRWNQDDIDSYLSTLILDDRGNRQGFPSGVLNELVFLSNLRWQIQHPDTNRADEVLLEQFSFSPASQLDDRYCLPSSAWLLA